MKQTHKWYSWELFQLGDLSNYPLNLKIQIWRKGSIKGYETMRSIERVIRGSR